MPRWAKVAIWIVVFATCAGAGAYVAAHTDPFPPGVDDPGARATPDPTGDAPADEERWRVTVRGSATHVVRVGGTCESAWSGSARFRVVDDALPEGARVSVDGVGSCDFPVAQIQAEQLELEIFASDEGNDLVSLRVVGRTPTGAEDLGGFATAIVRERFAVAADEAARVRGEIADGRGGTIRSVIEVATRCVSGCA
ncbi:MAG TPA: hypothetical protein VLA82_08720 [Actinomycetota bacterium]|nr:hypothetical protein [Actinomycetota bacterium]